MKCYFGEEEKPFARIYEPYTCCDAQIEVYDKDDKKNFTVNGTCCQPGLCCCCGGGVYGGMSQSHFGIFNKEKTDFDEKNCDGKITKKGRGINALFSDADTFEIGFPADSSVEDKLSLIATTLLLDYMFFEDGGAYGR